MCEILLKAKNNVNPDPELDKMSYKRGHFVAVMPDGHPWGKKECLPDFVILKVPGVSVTAFEKYLESKVDLTDSARPVMLSRRINKLDIDATTIPKSIRDSLKNNGVATITKTQILDHIRG